MIYQVINSSSRRASDFMPTTSEDLGSREERPLVLGCGVRLELKRGTPPLPLVTWLRAETAEGRQSR